MLLMLYFLFIDQYLLILFLVIILLKNRLLKAFQLEKAWMNNRINIFLFYLRKYFLHQMQKLCKNK